jgi:hypothetical protein
MPPDRKTKTNQNTVPVGYGCLLMKPSPEHLLPPTLNVIHAAWVTGLEYPRIYSTDLDDLICKI